MTEATQQSSAAYDFVLKFYDKQPQVSIFIAVIVTITPILMYILHYLNRRLELNNIDKQNIRDHKYRMKKGA